ncbi:VWA domain-containing protein [Leptospira sp. WS92.C1]
MDLKIQFRFSRIRIGILSILFFFGFLGLFQNCSSNTSSYYYSQKQIEYGDLNFHRHLKVNEYINAFPQDEIMVPEKQDLTLQVHSFAKKTISKENKNLIQIAVKTRFPNAEESKDIKALCFVLDVSGSMNQGSKLEDSKTALINFLMEMKTGDEFSLVLFSDNATTLIPPQKIDSDSRPKIISKVKEIRVVAGTNIEAGLILGYSEMTKFAPLSTKRLILLTDGISNVGVLTPKEIAAKAKVQYLEGSRISTIGLGYDVNQSLLRTLAENGRGHYYFADSAKTLTKIIRDDFETLVIPIAKKITLNIVPNPGYKILKIYGAPENTPISFEKIVLNLGELNANDWRIIVLEVSGNQGSYNPISAQLTYSHIKTNRSQTISAILSKEIQSSNLKVNQNVARNSVIFSNAISLIEIGKLAEANRYQDALDLVNLQINNNRVLAEIDKIHSIDQEIETLGKVQNILQSRIGFGNLSDPKSESSKKDKKSLWDFVRLGVSLTGKVIPGPWTIIAELFLVLVESEN